MYYWWFVTLNADLNLGGPGSGFLLLLLLLLFLLFVLLLPKFGGDNLVSDGLLKDDLNFGGSVSAVVLSMVFFLRP